jgi:PIN domain nuclease of toxin-antitoxin system
LDIKPEHVHGLGDLPNYHGDPFDRLLIAQAKTESYKLVTKDANIHAYHALVQLLW